MKKVIYLIIFIVLSTIISTHTQAQSLANCGSIIDGEFTEPRQLINYSIGFAPRDKFYVTGTVVGDFLKFDIEIKSPSNVLVGFNSDHSFRDWDTSATPRAETGVLSERGTYTVNLLNNDSFGPYTLYIGCTLADGTVIEPGQEQTQDEGEIGGEPFSGVGFPGLSPVDFNNAVLLPFNISAPNPGGIAPGFDSVFGFTLDANAGDIFDVAVTRISGNLNLGVVILSADNKVVFYGGLITSESLSTRLTLPSAGQYTIGVFRVDLLPPDAPEATAFQVIGTLNP
jgi:hypothetical protein